MQETLGLPFPPRGGKYLSLLQITLLEQAVTFSQMLVSHSNIQGQASYKSSVLEGASCSKEGLSWSALAPGKCPQASQWYDFKHSRIDPTYLKYSPFLTGEVLLLSFFGP